MLRRWLHRGQQWCREERQLLTKVIQLAAFLVVQVAILYITGTLQLLGASFFLSVFVVLEFLYGIGIAFWMEYREQEIGKQVGEHVSHQVGLILISRLANLGQQVEQLQQQLEQIQYIQIDIERILDQLDTRLAVIEEKLPKSRIRKLAYGTSEHPATTANDLAASTTSNGA